MSLRMASHTHQQDDTKDLLCTHSSCGRRWSVNTGSPKCSAHQWGRGEDFAPHLSADPMDNTDGRGWARRIVSTHEAGGNVRIISLQFARQALGIHA